MDSRSHLLLRDPVPVRHADALLRRHRHFARTWGRGWAWRECPGSHRVERMREGNSYRRISPMEAYRAAADRLSCHRSSARWLVPIEEMTEGRTPFLLPPTTVATTHDVSDCVDRLLEAGRCLPEAFLFAACTVLAEMSQNICDHSGDTGCVAVCWAPDVGTSGGSLGIGVVDAGIGIAGSLAPRFRERGLAAPGSEQAILAALKLDDWPGRRRGTGLCMSRKLVERYDGCLHLRSGGVALSVDAAADLISSRCPRRFAAVPGTQIAIHLRLDIP